MPIGFFFLRVFRIPLSVGLRHENATPLDLAFIFLSTKTHRDIINTHREKQFPCVHSAVKKIGVFLAHSLTDRVIYFLMAVYLHFPIVI